MDEKFSRTEMLIGNEGMEKLKNAKVAVFGLGGVGSFVVVSVPLFAKDLQEAE